MNSFLLINTSLSKRELDDLPFHEYRSYIKEIQDMRKKEAESVRSNYGSSS
jgi:hypothetical protein